MKKIRDIFRNFLLSGHLELIFHIKKNILEVLYFKNIIFLY